MEIYDWDSCSYVELKKLNLKIELYDYSISAEKAVRHSLNELTGDKADSTSSHLWVDTVLACSFSDEEIALINQKEGPYPLINKNCCNDT